MFDLKEMMKNMPEMLNKAKAMQENLQSVVAEGSAGGGMVVVKMTGAGELTSLRIDREVVDPNEIEMLQDLILAAVADARRKTGQAGREKMSELTGGIDLSSLGLDVSKLF